MYFFNRKIFLLVFFVSFTTFLYASRISVFAHPGRTDSLGCHTCRTNCSSWGLNYGEYHCHRAKTLPQPKMPVKSIRGEQTGKTIPAPEYTKPIIPTINKMVGTGTSTVKTTNIEQDYAQNQKKGFWSLLINLFK